jgi:hypothetical protein
MTVARLAIGNVVRVSSLLRPSPFTTHLRINFKPTTFMNAREFQLLEASGFFSTLW